MFHEKLCEIHPNILSCTYLCGVSIVLLQLLTSLGSPTVSLPKYPLNIYGGVLSTGLPGSLSYVDLLFCREQVSTCFCRKDSTGDIISGVLKTRTAKGCSLQGCIVTYEK